jgi:hypothetical protein
LLFVFCLIFCLQVKTNFILLKGAASLATEA